MSREAWREEILKQLERRKIIETNPFCDLVNSHSDLLRGNNVFKLRNSELELQAYQLKQEILELQGRLAKGGGVPSADSSSSNSKSYEQKIYKLQEELTELHRTKGKHTQNIIQLTNEMKAKDDIIQQKEACIEDHVSNVSALRVETKRLHCVVVELESSNQTIKDEIQALQLLNNSTEEKLRKTQDENIELVQRWMEQKAQVADQLNMQNEAVACQRQQKLQQELQDAAKEQIVLPTVKWVPENGNFSTLPGAIVCCTTVPDRPLQSLDCHEGGVMSVRFSPSGRYFVTGGADRKVKVWEIEGRGTVREVTTLTGCQQSVTCTRFDPLEKLILASSNDNACWIWSINDMRLRHTLTGHDKKVMAVKFLGTDSSKIASGSYDRTLKIWDLRSKICTKTIFAGSSCNDLVTSDVAGTTVISGHFDKKVRFWDIRCDQNVNEVQLQGKVTSLDLSQDMNYLLASTRDDALKMIDLRTNQIVSTYKSEGFKVAFDYTRACFSPDAQYVLCGSHDTNLYCWNTGTNKLDKILKDHKSAVSATAWHPNGCLLLSGDKNKRVTLWSDV